MSVNIGALIVTFNPEIDLLIRNIESVTNQVDKIIIVDNGSRNIDDFSLKIKSLASVIELKRNKGIAAAQNIGMQNFYNLKFDWVLTLDQDTEMPLNAIRLFAETSQFNDAKTGILAAQYIDRNWTKEQQSKLVTKSNRLIEKELVISSGNLVRTKAWKEVHGFDEFLFIDFVDDDFDCKLSLKKYKIWEVPEIKMFHSIGVSVRKPRVAKLLGYHNFSVFYDHSAFREFYIQRNRLIFVKRYPKYRRHKYLPEIFTSLIHLRAIFIYSKPRFPKLLAAMRGINQGMHYKVEEDSDFQSFLKSTKDNRTKCEEI